MSSISNFFIGLFLLSTLACCYADLAIPSILHASWVNGSNKFEAGDQAAVRVVLYTRNREIIQPSFVNPQYLNFSLDINGVQGGSIYISNVTVVDNNDDITIMFMTVVSGKFSLEMKNNDQQIENSPLSFSVNPGPMYLSACVGSWKGDVNSTEAGKPLTLIILLKDAFGNSVSSTINNSSLTLFLPRAIDSQGQTTQISNVSIISGKSPEYAVLTFVPTTAGDQRLLISRRQVYDEFISNSPLLFTVNAGNLSLQNTYAEWKYGVTVFPTRKLIKVYIRQRDVWGNPVVPLTNFEVLFYNASDLSRSIPFSDFYFQPSSKKGSQLLTFTSTTSSGKFSLYIADTSDNNIGGCPYNFSVVESRMVSENKSIVFGSGLEPSTAGKNSSIFVQLKDINGKNVDGYARTVSAVLNFGKESERRVIGSRVFNRTGLYRIDYALNVSGNHDILVLYCHTALNSGIAFKKVVYSGDVDINRTTAHGLRLSIAASVTYDISVVLRDMYGNLVPAKQEQLNIVFEGHVLDPPEPSAFTESKTGNYTMRYEVIEIKPLSISVFYDRTTLLPGFPYNCFVHSYGWFPRAEDDKFTTWQGTATLIDVLSNDHFDRKPGVLLGIKEQPKHGVAFMKGQFIMYVPQRGYIGPDTFLYEVRDTPKNVSAFDDTNMDAGVIIVSVISRPPEIIALPENLQVCQGGGLKFKRHNRTIMVDYPVAPPVNLHIDVSAKHGHVRVIGDSDMSWQLYTSLHSNDNTSNFESVNMDCRSDVVTPLLDSLFYIGSPDYSGFDEITLSIKDDQGLGEERSFFVAVNKINSPPYIESYPYILVDKQTGNFLAGFDASGEEINDTPLIAVFDPDINGQAGDVSEVELSLQVENGNLIMELPESKSERTEIRYEESYYWTPLSDVSIDNGVFAVQANGIKFRGSLDECNTALRKTKYNGSTKGCLLSVMVNDLGHHGIDKTCSSTNMYPLSVEVQLSLVTKRPGAVVKGATTFIILAIAIPAVFMVIIICILVLVVYSEKLSFEVVKSYVIKENEMDKSRVYNPMWIPSASSNTDQVHNTFNPLHVQHQKHIFKEGVQSANEEMKEMLTSEINNKNASIRRIKKSLKSMKEDQMGKDFSIRKG